MVPTLYLEGPTGGKQKEQMTNGKTSVLCHRGFRETAVQGRMGPEGTKAREISLRLLGRKEPPGPESQRSGKSLGAWEKPPPGYPAVLLHRTLRGTNGSQLVLDGRGSGQRGGSEQ